METSVLVIQDRMRERESKQTANISPSDSGWDEREREKTANNSPSDSG